MESPLRTTRLKKAQVVDLELLDQLLDEPVAAFDRTVRRLVKEFRCKQIAVAVPASAQLPALDERTRWTGLYEAEVRRLPRMDRRQEFLMARRYEFMVARVDDALRAAGYPKQQVPELRHQRPEGLPRSPKRRSTTYLHRCMADLIALRSRYVEGALYLVGASAFRYRGLGVDMVDLVQEGNASLFQAIDGFDWRRDVRFKTYAQYWIQQAVLKTLYNSSRTVRIPIWVQKTLRKIQRLRERGHPVTGGEMNNAAIAKALDMPEKRIDELLSTRRYAVSIDAEMPGESGATLATMLADDDQLPVHETISEGKLQDRLHEVMAVLPQRERTILVRRFGLDGKAPETLGEIAADLGITAERVRQLQNAALERVKKPGLLKRLADFV
ncbi:MAG: sigma-70 family RNA polymerase sigma factor [Planctomycetota bacterium]|jgi:RNA polymerase sigma factor (sigma-70 family)